MSLSPNNFPGKCADCGANVPAKSGTRQKVGARWIVRHLDGECGAAPVATAPAFAPTAEQVAALTLFATGESMVIEAGAGTGKTSTLELIARSTNRRGQYIAFNKAIVVEAETRFPANVRCDTAHRLAMRAVGNLYRHRLDAPRQSPNTVARLLDVDSIQMKVGNDGFRSLAAGWVAGHVMRALANFCKTADDTPDRSHFDYVDGIDPTTADGRRTFANNDELTTRLMPALARAWADIQRNDGQLRFGHDHYLKMWQLSEPVIDADFIMFDEAQDANPVMAAIVAAQTHAQVVYVGDSQQAIYEFTGAVNTLATLDTDHRVFLTKSFRFGPAVAEVANTLLDRLAADLRVVGFDAIASTVGMAEREDAILCRTNAKAVETVMELLTQGRKPHLVGGGVEVVRFAKAARDLMAGSHTSHPELACFSTWGEVQAYVANDIQGNDLRLMVKLVDDFGPAAIISALDRNSSADTADVIVSTAHKSKGLEWNAVRIADDFPVDPGKVGPAELRLMYVACTRAKLNLDCTALSALLEGPTDEDEDAEPAMSGEDALRQQGWRG